MELKVETSHAAKTIPYKNLADEMQQRILQNVFDLLTTGVHSDLTIVLKDGETTGSRLVLAALSPYFNAMLSADMKEKQSDIIHLPTASLTTYHNIFKAHFLREDVVKEDNFSDLFEASQMMELSYLEKICLWYFEDCLSLDNSLDIFRLLKLHGYEEQAQHVMEFLSENFHYFSLTDIVTGLTRRELVAIISSKALVCEELDVLKTVIRWIEYNNPSADDITELFSHVHMELVDPEYLVMNVVYSTIVTENNAVKAMLQKGLEHNLNHLKKHRSELEDMDVVVVFGKGKLNRLLFFASLTEKRWYNIPSAPFSLGKYYSATCCQNKIYITGGQDTTRSTLIYDLLRGRWSQGPTLHDDRYDHCMAMVGDRVYAIGGSKSSTIERLDQQLGRWERVGDLGARHGDSCAIVVGNNVLVCGGDDGSRPSDVIFCFNTETCTISKVGNLPVCCSSVRAYSDLPIVYLITEGKIYYFKVEESDNKCFLRSISETIVPCEEYTHKLAFIVNCDDMLMFTNKGITRFQGINGQDELTPKKEVFDSPPLIEHLFGILRMRLSKNMLNSTEVRPQKYKISNR